MGNTGAADIERICKELLEWIERNGWYCYDPYDLRGTKIVLYLLRRKSASAQKIARRVIAALERTPLAARKLLGVKRSINPKALGLLAAAYANLAEAKEEGVLVERAKRCADWLLDNPSPGYSGLCWGYPFDWQSRVFIPNGTPSAVVSAVVGDGLWRLAVLTDENRYWDACGSVCEFMVNDLNIDRPEPGKLCFSYTPIDRFHVHNANLFVAEFLARVGRKTGRGEYVDLAIQAGDYALSEQRADGSLSYWGEAEGLPGRVQRDCYHSGFEIRALWGLWKATGEARFCEAALRYLDFFRRAYLREDGSVWLRPHHQYPVDIHG